MRLDARTALYGEPRLSNAQVQCLRYADRAPLRPIRAGWVSSGSTIDPVHRQGTILALAKLHLVCVEPNRTSIRITQRGQELLAAIDAALARRAA